ncbi:hypothetical protein [Luteolibacter sp. AS25]|uniref:hypothetical protein n=1 Tax=Luteolibacter sp. AS25 TaxID=3135776 RepID=UPI00398ABE12
MNVHFRGLCKYVMWGGALAHVGLSNVDAATTSIEYSASQISQPYLNSTTVSVTQMQYGLRIYSLGSQGANSSSNPAGTGGSASNLSSVGNAAEVTLNSYSGGQARAVFYESNGGGGGNYTNTNGDHNSGSGGSGGNITGSNTGDIRGSGSFSNGLYLLHAESIGGVGGSSTSKNPTHTDGGYSGKNAYGGNGGYGNSISLTNSGEISLAGGTNVTGDGYFRGIQGISHGGDGGTGRVGGIGGYASDVNIFNYGKIDMTLRSVTGDQISGVVGIRAESTGGTGQDSYKQYKNGGNGGNAGSVTIASSEIDIDIVGENVNYTAAGIAAYTTGGDGGKAWNGGSDGNNYAGAGGSAGSITIGVQENLTFSGSGAVGVIAESKGGKGGDGTDNEKSYSGAGGDSGEVYIVVQDGADLTMSGNNSPGIFTLSASGSGGTTPTSSQDAGGTAGAGGNGGRTGGVVVDIDGGSTLSTSGANSIGIFAVSEGGSGGAGGELSTNGDAFGDGAGKGGVGSAGGEVTITLADNSSLRTAGKSSAGVAAISSGGNGGAGGKYKGIGGGEGANGGNGGNGGSVTVDLGSGANVETGGDYSHAIIAASLSGNGGAGGDENATVAGSSGAGGRGGDTGKVLINNHGFIQTHGDGSFGILAQGFSGGGGGSGDGSSVFKTGIDQAGLSGSVGFVEVLNYGVVNTLGDNSYGLLAQSVSGSGGVGGSSELGIASLGGDGAYGTDGGAVELDHNGSITTAGDGSHGALLHTVGGGGGDAGSAAGLVSIGGSGSGGGNGGAIIVDLYGSEITTTGSLASGLLAQSIGGGGGNGGDATAAGPGAALSIGGTAGGGGNGGDVSLLSSARISTGGGVVTVPDQDNPGETNTIATGSKSAGILLQSVGGGGGNGGSAYALSVGPGLSSAAAVGGSGGDGGDGGNVTLTTEGGSIHTGQYDLSKLTTANTLPTDSFGIVAQSIGGGGGSGGSSFAEALAIAVTIPGTDTPIAATAAFSTGGSGGKGGSGGRSAGSDTGVVVNLTKGTQVMTEGQGSHGVLAQGVGGGGGLGGDSSAFAATLGYGFAAEEGPTVSLAIESTLGAKGGDGGRGGDVQVNVGENSGNGATILTLGDFSNGVTAQSIGGGGGNAGLGSGTTENYGGSKSVSASIGLGASGGTGGDGSLAEINLKEGSDVTTYGDGSNGLLVQSIGGGGGTSQGGTLSLGTSFSVKAGKITEGSSDSKVGFKGDLGVSLGATGGAGGGGAAANALVAGKITTHGNDSTGILVQSIGGGGGVAGAAGAFASPDAPWTPSGENFIRAKKIYNKDIAVKVDLDFSADLSLGSLNSGASGGGGNAVFDDLGGAEVDTSGDWSSGILVQSIGNGGGKAGSAVATGQGASNQIDLRLGGNSSGTNDTPGAYSSGGLAEAFVEGTLIRSGIENGYSSFGLVVQSIGGGGGLAADNSDSAIGSIAVGNGGETLTDQNGKVSGDGGDSFLSGTAEIQTSGIGGHAVVLQSIGGGGGIGGAGTSSENAFASSIELAVGGNAYSSGSGSDVTIDSPSVLTLRTNNDHAYGILAQSIGGGGGLGAVVDPRYVSIAGTQSATGGTNRSRGGNLSLSLGASKITTSGLNSHGVVAQSIGGGGGIAGYSSTGNFSVSNPSAGYGYGDAGNVAIALNPEGTITTTGARAHGILAQSIAGGGGIVNGVAGRSNKDGSGYAGRISITVDGQISVSGEGSYGVFAQQDAPQFNGQANANITVGGSVVSADTAIVIESENGQVITDAGGLISGPIAVQRVGESAYTLNIINSGTISGSILGDNDWVSGTGTQTTAMVNTGEFIAGPSVQASVLNRGLFRVRELTLMEGPLVQEDGGTLISHADFSPEADVRLIVDDDADLDGKLNIAGQNVTGIREVEVLRVNGDFINSLEIDENSAVLFDYTLRHGEDRILVSADADFTPDEFDLSKNAVAVGNYLQNGFYAEGADSIASLFDALEALAVNEADYQDGLHQLTPGAGLGFASREMWAQLAFANTALGEKVLRGDSARPVEVQSLWAKTSGSSFDGDSYDSDSYSTLIGGQYEYTPNFFIGGAFGFRADQLEAHDGSVSGEGDTVLGALTAKYEPGDWSFAVALSGSFSGNDATRRIRIPGHETQMDISPDVASVGILGQFGYTFHNEWGYVRPMLSAGIIHVNAEGYTEGGASNLRLLVDDASQTALVVTPGVEAGIRSDLSNGMTVRSYVSGGLSFSTVDEWEQQSHFSGGPRNIGAFNTALPQDDVVLRITTGCQLQFTEVLSGYIQYEGEFSDSISNNGGGIGIVMEF